MLCRASGHGEARGLNQAARVQPALGVRELLRGVPDGLGGHQVEDELRGVDEQSGHVDDQARRC
jgi:hypothetical protein